MSTLVLTKEAIAEWVGKGLSYLTSSEEDLITWHLKYQTWFTPEHIREMVRDEMAKEKALAEGRPYEPKFTTVRTPLHVLQDNGGVKDEGDGKVSFQPFEEWHRVEEISFTKRKLTPEEEEKYENMVEKKEGWSEIPKEPEKQPEQTIHRQQSSRITDLTKPPYTDESPTTTTKGEDLELVQPNDESIRSDKPIDMTFGMNDGQKQAAQEKLENLLYEAYDELKKNTEAVERSTQAVRDKLENVLLETYEELKKINPEKVVEYDEYIAELQKTVKRRKWLRQCREQLAAMCVRRYLSGNYAGDPQDVKIIKSMCQDVPAYLESPQDRGKTLALLSLSGEFLPKNWLLLDNDDDFKMWLRSEFCITQDVDRECFMNVLKDPLSFMGGNMHTKLIHKE